MTGCASVPGGIAAANQNVLRALCELAAEQGRPLTVVSYLETSSARPRFLPSWIPFRALGRRRTGYARVLLAAAARRPLFCFDHVTLALPVLPLAAAGLVRTVIFAHGSEAWKRLRRTSRWSFLSASLVLTNSDFTLRQMRQRLPGLVAAACPLGLTPDFPLHVAPPVPSAAPVYLEAADGVVRPVGARSLLLVGRLDPREREKGHRQLIALLPHLLAEFPDVQLVFPGPGDDREPLKAFAIEHSVAGAVFLPGLVPMDLLQQLYARCYAFVMPSRQEGFGLAYLEAMSYGKPCVGCFDQGAEDVIVHGQTGFLVRDPDDPAELAGVLRPLLRDPALARRLGKHGFRRLHERFTARHHQERVKEQVRRLL